MPLDVEGLDPDPTNQLATWLADAETAGIELPGAFALATATQDGQPSVRMVLLHGLDADGLRFFTNRSSLKGRELAANPRAAVAFHWASLSRQVRLAGEVVPLTDQESAAYWATRSRASRLSAWASVQGSEIASRAKLEARVAELDQQFPDDNVPLPPFWGGYLLTPEVVEFWEGREDRLHDRVEYIRDGVGGWHRRRLQP
jgi:pyridoxamine 5'-phosphate oxidase